MTPPRTVIVAYTIYFYLYEVSFQNILVRTVNNTWYVCVCCIYTQAYVGVGWGGAGQVTGKRSIEPTEMGHFSRFLTLVFSARLFTHSEKKSSYQPPFHILIT